MKKISMNLMGLLIIFLTIFVFLVTNLTAQVNRGAGVPAGSLPKDLKGLDIKDYFVPSSFKRVGVIHALRGKVVVVHRASKAAYFGRPGDIVYENDTLNTMAKSRCRVRFHDDDIVTMAPNTDFSVESFQDQRKKGKKRSMFSMVKGKAMFYAMRLFRYKETRFSLKTPTVTVGVRGTKFGAHVYWEDEGKSADAGLIKVADKGNDAGRYLAQTGSGGGRKSFTDAFSEDGRLSIKKGDKIIAVVNPDELWKGNVGKTIETPVGYAAKFNRDVAVSAGEKKAGEDEGQEGSGTGDQTTTESRETPDVANITSQQEGEKTESENTYTYTITHGYFTAMLTKDHGTLYDIFISMTRGAFPGTQRADSIIDNDYLNWGGGAFTKVTTANGGTPHDDIDITTTWHPVTDDGHDFNYLDYGYWETHDQTFPGSTYDFWNHAWGIEGDATPCAVVDGLNGDYAYSGVAHGTYWDTSTGTRMDGTFSCNVDFGDKTIDHFNISVAGGGHTATISDAAGAFGSSHFDIDNGTGTWKIDGASATFKGAYGSLWGPGGEEIGGVWGMYVSGSPSKGAIGIFAGSK